jgi:hypothetical protein
MAVGGGARVITSTAVETVTTNAWELARIRWVSSAAAANDECKITDTAGNIIFDSFATGADWEDEIELGKVNTFLGIKTATLTSGKVFFYLR